MIYEALFGIAQASGSNDKKQRLKAYDDKEKRLRNVLWYAYNPYLHYGLAEQLKTPDMTEAINFSGGANHRYLDEYYFELLDALANRKLTGHEALYMVRDAFLALSPKNAKVYRQILLKDLKCGINVKTINAVFPKLIPTFDVMLAQKVNWDKVTFPCYSSVKMDGVRAILRDGKLLTRSGRPIVGCDHIIDQFEGTDPIDGELMIPGLNFDKGSGQIRSKGNCPTAMYYVFDYAKYIPMTYMARTQLLYDQIKLCPHINIMPMKLVLDQRHALGHYDDCIKEGYEGTILKPQDYGYETKRSWHWQKLKQEESHDLKCIGFYEGEGKYKGSLGGIIVDYDGVEVRVGGGYANEERDYIWNNQDVYLGMIAEVYGQETTAAGSLRHPNFLRWRLDLEQA